MKEGAVDGRLWKVGYVAVRRWNVTDPEEVSSTKYGLLGLSVSNWLQGAVSTPSGRGTCQEAPWQPTLPFRQQRRSPPAGL